MRTTTKAVINKLQAHILEKFGVEFYGDNYEVTNLANQINSMRINDESDQKTAKGLVEGGTFLCYYQDVVDFLKELDINDKDKEYSDQQGWDLYIHLLSREICKLIN